MGRLIELYDWLSQEGVLVFDRQLPFSDVNTKAVTIKLEKSDTWGIFIDDGRISTTAEKIVTAYHEGGHYATGSTHEMCSPQDIIEKHEYKADKWAISKLIPKDELEEAVRSGHTEPWDLAEVFGVTEEFMRKAIYWYQCADLEAG